MVHKDKQARKRDDDEQAVDEEAPQGAETKENLDEDIDGILDEIDDVLEANAEEFVRGFIQKGGQ